MALSSAPEHCAETRPVTDRRQFLGALSPRGACAAPLAAEYGDWIRVHRRAMACRFEVVLASVDCAFVLSAMSALDEIDRVERELSVFIADSVISGVNRDAAIRAVAVPPGV